MAIPPKLHTTSQQISSSTKPQTQKSTYYCVEQAFRDLATSSPLVNLNESVILVSFGTRGARGRGGRGHDSGEIEAIVSCYFHREPRHVKKYCPKLNAKTIQPSWFAHVMTSSMAQEYENNCNVIMSKNEYVNYKQFQASW